MGKWNDIRTTSLLAILLLSVPTPLFARATADGTAGIPSASREAKFGPYRPSANAKKPFNPAKPGKRLDGQKQRQDIQPLRTIKGGPEFWGVVEYSAAWDDQYANESEYPYGVYSFLASNPGNMTPLLMTGTSGPNAGGVFYDNSFHYVNFYVMYETQVITYTYDYNTVTWEQNNYAQYGSDDSIIGTDLTYDASTGNVYGYFYNPLDMNEPMRFGSIEYTPYGAQVTTIAELDQDFICIAADAEGQLFGISSDGGFWSIDKTSGRPDLIDYTGVRPSTFRQSATFDPNTGRLYWAAFREDYSSGLYEINPDNGVTTLIAEIPDSMEISCLHIPLAKAADDAPAAVGDLSVSFSGGMLSGTATFTAPAETYAGDPLTGILSYLVTANGDTISQGSADAGEKVSTEISLAESGRTEFAVYTKNTTGRSPESNKVSLWIGYDIPETPTNVVLAVNQSDRKAMLTWDAPTAGVNEGYFDASSLTYNVVRYPGAVAVATNLATTQFSEVLPDTELASYYYTVAANNGNMTGSAVESNREIVGRAFDVPFKDDFSTDDTYDLYTVIDANGDGTTWNSSMNAFSYFYSWTENADDWLITPPVKLQQGKVYKFAFDIRSGSSSGTEKFAAAFGTGTDPLSYAELISPQEIKSSDYTNVSQTFQADTDGEYRFAVHALSDANQYGLYVTNFCVTEESNSAAPDSVSNILITPAPLGELKATIRFNAPAVDRNKDKLSELTKVEIYRNKTELVTAFDSPAIGELIEYEDTKPENGMNYYTFVGYNASGKGTEVTDSAWIGQDVPLQPRNVTLTDNGSGIALAWEIPDNEGIHGGYVDGQLLTYSIYDRDGLQLASDIDATEWTLDMNLESATDVIYFNVAAKNIAGESDPSMSTYLVTGKPADLPYHESFPNGGTTETFWWTIANNQYNGFSFSPEMQYSYDHDSGSAYWYGISAGDFAELNSGRISLEGTGNPALFFNFLATPGKNLKMTVLATTGDGTCETLLAYDFLSLTGDTGWHNASVFFSERLKQAPYFVLTFRLESPADDNMVPVYIDNIVMRDVPDYDLAVTAIQSPTSVMAGKNINAAITIANLGASDAAGFTVDLWADDGIVASTDIRALSFNCDTTVTLPYTPPVSAGSTANIRATVSFAADEIEENNTSETVNIAITKPDYPTVTDLTAERSTDGVVLNWSAPPEGENAITENFDTFDPWMTGGFGEWTAFDGDRMETNAYTSMWFPNIGEEFAYIVFNKKYAVMDVSQESVFSPVSGDQCLAAFATVHDYSKDIPTDDWIISPELSGEAQTISFYIKSFTDYQEDYYVYYATERPDTADMRRHLISFEKWEAGSTWTKKEYDVPAGAKYFGIRYTSNLSGILIDDFSYVGKRLEIAGYNIYRDGQWLANVGPDTLQFTDTTVDDGDHTYVVTTLYTEGESIASNPANTGSGIGSIISDDHPADIYTVSGILIRSNATTLEGLPHGVYIVGDVKVIL